MDCKSYDVLRQMLAELELECNIQFHGESSVKIKELEAKVKELETLNDSYQKAVHEYTAAELATKLHALGYKGEVFKTLDIRDGDTICGRHRDTIILD